MNKKTVILTSYLENEFNLSDCLNSDDTLLCTDGGYDIALAHNITPHILLGDLDSIQAEVPSDIPVIKFNPIKDFTDLQLALDKCIELGSRIVEIWGGIGGRFDQTVANIQILSRYQNAFDSLKIKDGANEAFILEPGKAHSIPAVSGYYLSFFSLSSECKGVTITGTKYELSNHTLTYDFPLGVSNEFTSSHATVSYENGKLLAILSKM